MKKVYQIIVFVSFLAFTFLINPTLYAAEGLKLGDSDVEVIPWGEIKVQYDDNVFLDRDDEKDDLIVTLTPGIRVEWPFQDNRLRLGYHIDFHKFIDNTSQDAVDHHLSAEAEINWRDVRFTIYDNFDHLYERPTTEDTSRIKRNDNTFGIRADFQRERLGIQLGYENFTRNYKDDTVYDAYDRTDHKYSFMVTHQTFSKTKTLFEYDFGQTRYDNSASRSDSDYHQFLIGAIGELTPRTTATIKTGYRFRDYENGSDPDFDTGVLSADIIHKFSDKNALKLSLLRSAEESTYGVNNFYKIEKISAVFDHFFSNKLLGFVTGQHQINSYPEETTEGTETKKRKDKYSSLGVGLRYYMREWLTLTFKIEHIMRNSNFDVFEYDQNLATFTARAEF